MKPFVVLLYLRDRQRDLEIILPVKEGLFAFTVKPTNIIEMQIVSVPMSWINLKNNSQEFSLRSKIFTVKIVTYCLQPMLQSKFLSFGVLGQSFSNLGSFSSSSGPTRTHRFRLLNVEIRAVLEQCEIQQLPPSYINHRSIRFLLINIYNSWSEKD